MLTRTFWLSCIVLLFSLVAAQPPPTPNCTKDQCATAKCINGSTILCTNGTLAGQCFFTDPTWYSYGSDNCNEICDATYCSTTNNTLTGCDLVCPLNWCSASWLCDHDQGDDNYMCIFGDATTGCSSDPGYWQEDVGNRRYVDCLSCCNTHSCLNTCGIACETPQCTAGSQCNATNPFFCSSGPKAGQCLSDGANTTGCNACCDTTKCNRQNFTCSHNCSQEECNTGHRCLDGLPYMCTSGFSHGGCSSISTYWPESYTCDSCCYAQTCDFTCKASCSPSQCSATCAEQRPPSGEWYLCTEGPDASNCTPVASQFGTGDQKCFACCNASSCPRI